VSGRQAVPTPVRWGRERVQDLLALWAAALPAVAIRAGDLERCCFDESVADPAGGRVGPAVTFGIDLDGPGPVGAIAVTTRHLEDLVTAHVQVLVVHPDHRRRGVGRALVGAAEAWAFDAGAALVQLGAAAPHYLFTGVDAGWTEALCLAEALGYQRSGVELDLVCPTAPAVRPPAPEGLAVRSVPETDRGDVVAFARRCFPQWEAEWTRGLLVGRVVVARDRGGRVVGAAAHSVNRPGVIGPVGVDPDLHGTGVGSRLMAGLLEDLHLTGVVEAEIAWTSTVRFYANACGARVGRSSLLLHRWQPPAEPEVGGSVGS
jgi:mycothiol synthase